MGEVELDIARGIVKIHADIYFYGYAASDDIAKMVAKDIESHWNEPALSVSIKYRWYTVQFHMNGFYSAFLTPEEIYENNNPRNNYFRVENFARGNISFVDGLNSNTGYFLLDNLLNGSTTAAHEFGHTLGLDHPHNLDIRGKGVPGIMYPRGTIVDPPYQYDPNAAPGKPGGTMNPFTRKVLIEDIQGLKLNKLRYNRAGKAVLGDFSSLWHEAHQP